MFLAGTDGKHGEPGKELLIEPGSYETLHRWLSKSPNPEVLDEFINHFKCHSNAPGSPAGKLPLDAQQNLRRLMEVWDTLFGVHK
jgi:hypothetical protein